MARGQGKGWSYTRASMGMAKSVMAWAQAAPWVNLKGGKCLCGRARSPLVHWLASKGKSQRGGGVKTLFQPLPLISPFLSSSLPLFSPSQHMVQTKLEK